MYCRITVTGKGHKKRARELAKAAREHLGATIISERHGETSVLRVKMTFYGIEFLQGLYPDAAIECGSV